MQTEETDSLTSENFGVLRMQRKTFNERSNVGGIFTSRMGRNGSKNFVYGLDKKINIYGDLYIDLLASQTLDTEIRSDENTSFFTTTSWRAAVTLQKSVGFNFRLVVNRTGEHFDPGIGYVRRTGNTDISYDWHMVGLLLNILL